VQSIGHNVALSLFLSRSDANKRPYLLTTSRLEWVVERKFNLSFLFKKEGLCLTDISTFPFHRIQPIHAANSVHPPPVYGV
jgi:hypothetical protein